MKVLFVGDVVGEPGLAFLEAELPALLDRWQPDALIVNGENASVSGPASASGFGLAARDLGRLLALGVDAVTTGNHAWDAPDHEEVLAHSQVLRPLNYGGAPGKGALILDTPAGKLGVINAAGRSALPQADRPVEAVDAQLSAFGELVDSVLVDLHAESVVEKEICAALWDGRVSAVLGTHTHVPTLDAQLLPRGTAYVTDVGMVGPTGGVAGVSADYFRAYHTRRLPPRAPYTLAAGPVRLGAVFVRLSGRAAQEIRRVDLFAGKEAT